MLAPYLLEPLAHASIAALGAECLAHALGALLRCYQSYLEGSVLYLGLGRALDLYLALVVLRLALVVLRLAGGHV